MRQAITVSVLVAASCLASSLPAQQSIASVSSVRLAFERVDQVALDFGVDTAALRRRAVYRLSEAGMAVVQDPTQPVLTIAVRVPKQLPPVDRNVLRVEMKLLGPETSNPRRELWNALGHATTFTLFGSLRQIVPEELERRLDALTAAHSGT
jgi:hypothetical protein